MEESSQNVVPQEGGSVLPKNSSDALDKFPEDIYLGLHIPKTSHPIKKSVKEVIVKPAMTDEEIKAKEGKYFDEDDVDKIYKEDVDIYTIGADGKKKLLAKLRKQVIDPEIIKTGWEGFWITAAPSRNRGAAAGPIDVNGKYWQKRSPTHISGHFATAGKMRVNNNVFSSVLGYFNATPFMKLPCRLTSYTMRFWKYYNHGLPFIRAIDSCFKTLVPDRYEEQRKAAAQKPLLHITGTSFSSVTINRNFRTALHKDAGDFRDGYGNLSVIERGSYHGGYTLFPQYRIGFDIRTGDFLAMDVHEWHCNTELYETAEDKKANKDLPKIHKDDPETGTLGSDQSYSRVSFVCYLREKLRQCNDAQTRKYFKKIGFNAKSGKFNITRKKREG